MDEKLKKSVSESLEKFRADKSWDNFVIVLAKMKKNLEQRASYFIYRTGAESHETCEDIVSRLQVYLYEVVDEFDPSRGVDIFTFCHYKLGVYLENFAKVSLNRRRIDKEIYNSHSVKTVSENSLFYFIGELERELSEESRGFLRYIMSDHETMEMVLEIIDSKKMESSKRRRRFGDLYYRVLDSFRQLTDEVSELACKKNYQISWN